MKTIGTVCFLIVLMLFVPNSWGEDSVFTNKDLQKYQESTPYVPPHDTATHNEPMRRSGKLQPVCTEEVKAQMKARGGRCEEWREGERPFTGTQNPMVPQTEDKPKPVLNEDEPVTVSISGCQTLQEALDGKTGNTNAVITVRRKGRTIEEICETLGRGCKSCGEAPQQIGKNQSR